MSDILPEKKAQTNHRVKANTNQTSFRGVFLPLTLTLKITSLSICILVSSVLLANSLRALMLMFYTAANANIFS